MLDVSNRVMMISGANRGIGAALARAFHSDGWKLSLGARDASALQAAVSGLDPTMVSCHRYDANDASTAAAWVDATIDRHGRIDGLANNAGVAHVQPLEELTDELLDDMWAVNVKAPLKLIQLALPHLRRSGEGRIVNVVSMSGKRVKGTFGPGYAMSKHAALALHHAVRHATHADGIRSTAVCPGFVATDMTTEFGPEKAVMTQPEDLAETVATIVRLPNTANVAELLVTCEPEVMA